MTYKTNTRLITKGRPDKKERCMVNLPLERGSTVVFNDLSSFTKRVPSQPGQLTYGLHGTRTTFAFEQIIADLEHGYTSLSVCSGLAAITTALLAFVKQGDHILAVDSIYEPTRTFCDGMLRRMGITTTYYDPMIGCNIEALIRQNTRVILLESPGSLTFEVQDVPAIAAVAKKHNVVTILDNTWAAPLFYQPLDHGIDVSVVAATKYILGHSDGLLGVITCQENHYPALSKSRRQLGQSASPDDLNLALRSLRTIAIRMAAHQKQAIDLAKWLQQQPEVCRLLHPAFPNCPGHALWKRDFSGSSGLFSIELVEGDEDAVAAMINNMRLFALGASWGGYLSLIMPAYPEKSRSATKWKSKGPIIRLHAGLEALEDLIDDLGQGLARYQAQR